MTDEAEKAICDLIDNAEEFKPTPAALEIQGSGQGGDSGRRGQTQTDFLIKLAAEAAPFHTPDGTGYVDVKIKNHRETWPIKSRTCRQWLRQRYYGATGRAPNPEVVQRALDWLEDQAEFEGLERSVHVRITQKGDRIYLDLGDPEWRVVEIATGGWSIIEDPPVRFRRPAGMKSLPIPSERGSISALRPFLNVTPSDFVLVVAWMLAAMRGQGPYWVLALSGEQGSAKSTFSELIRALIDPNDSPLQTMPHNERDLYIATANGHVLAFDNVSDLKQWLSDALCQVSTGGSFAARRLYTDQEQFSIKGQCPMILNGIEEVITGQDLASRAMQITLNPISDNQRLPKDDLLANFEKARPGILGALLNALVEGLNNYANIRLEGLPRMADCTKFVMACEPALWQAGIFERSYRKNLDETVRVGIEADLVASAIVEWANAQTMQTVQTMNSRRCLPIELQIFAGTATDLNPQLRRYADESLRKSTQWPQSPRALSGRLRRATPALRKWGITIKNDLLGRKRTRMIYISVDIEQFMASPPRGEEVYPESECFVENDEEDSEVQPTTPGGVPKTPSASSAPSANTKAVPTPPEQPKRQGTVVVRKPVPKEMTTTAPPVAPEAQAAAAAKSAVKGHSVRKPRPEDVNARGPMSNPLRTQGNPRAAVLSKWIGSRLQIWRS